MLQAVGEKGQVFEVHKEVFVRRTPCAIVYPSHEAGGSCRRSGSAAAVAVRAVNFASSARLEGGKRQTAIEHFSHRFEGEFCLLTELVLHGFVWLRSAPTCDETCTFCTPWLPESTR